MRFLLRIILLVIALSVIRRLIITVLRYFSSASSVARTSPKAPPVSPFSHRADHPTDLQQDPVCGTYVATAGSLKRIVHGKVIHFCSEECRDRYPAAV